jgi:membrane protease YdiL (CAAX protease family)
MGFPRMKSSLALTYRESPLLRPLWRKLIGPPWVVSLLFYAAVATVRFVAFFSPWEMQHIFFLQTVAMWALPFIFLTRSGRREIGLTDQSPTFSSFLLSALAGAACAVGFFVLGIAVFGDSPDNWCISLRNYLHFDEMRGILPPAGLFALYALPAIFLNPIGEELLFRGFIQEAFARKFNRWVGTAVSSVLFALVYLYLHGVWRDSAGFHLRGASTALAVCLMSGVGVVFTVCRNRTQSLWPAMAAHAGFNLALLASAIVQFAR